MNKYIVTKPITLHAGVVRLTKGQLRGRAHKLESVGKDCYRIIAPNQFKVGEEFGFEGDLPKNMAENLTTKEAAEAAAKKAAAEAEKLAAKAAKEAEKANAKAAEKAEKVRVKMEADAKASWDADATLREQYSNNFNAFLVDVMEELG